MNIPKSMQEKYNEIATIIIAFCEQRLNDEYTDVWAFTFHHLGMKPHP